MIFGLNCLERLFPTPLFAACHLLQGLFLFSAVKRSQFGPCSSGCWEEELLPSCCRGEFPATLKCPRKGWKQNEAWQRTVPGRIVLSELCSDQVRISVSSGLSYMAEEVGSVCVRGRLGAFWTLPQFWPSKVCGTEKLGAESWIRFECLDLAVALALFVNSFRSMQIMTARPPRWSIFLLTHKLGVLHMKIYNAPKSQTLFLGRSP